MRLVATADTHFPIPTNMVPDGDVFILAGDMMYSGFADEWQPRIDSIAALPHKHKLFVPGNHDIWFQRFTGPCIQQIREAGVEWCGTETKPTHTIDGVRFGACPFVTNLPNWAYNSTEDRISDYLEDMGRVDVLICHSPPSGIMDSDGKGRYGLGAIRRYISRFEPDVVICGHVHEGYGEMKVGRTFVYNVAMCDEYYEQVNPPMIIEM